MTICDASRAKNHQQAAPSGVHTRRLFTPERWWDCLVSRVSRDIASKPWLHFPGWLPHDRGMTSSPNMQRRSEPWTV